MESESNKLFVGGITHSTNAENLRVYFNKYGEVKHAHVMRNRLTGLSRGFGFVSFSHQSSMESALQNKKHEILGRRVEVNIPKPIEKKPQNQNSLIHGNLNYSLKINKIFVGGLPPSLTKEEFASYFETFGRIIDSVIMYNKENNNSRGFGFVTYDSEESVQKVLIVRFHQLSNKLVDVKRAIPRGEAEINCLSNDSYQAYWGYAPFSSGYLSYRRPSPSIGGYYYNAHANQMGASNTQYHGQQIWVNNPNFALYPFCYQNMPCRQVGNSDVYPTYVEYRVNWNGMQREEGPSSSSNAVHGNGIAKSVITQEADAVENGVSEKPKDEISKVIDHADGVLETASNCSLCDGPEVVENEASGTPKDGISRAVVLAHGVVEAVLNCGLCECPEVVENGVSGTPKDEISRVIVHADGGVEAASHCSLCESPNVVENGSGDLEAASNCSLCENHKTVKNGVSGKPKVEISKVIVHSDSAVENALNCSICEGPKFVENGVSRTLKDNISKIIVHANSVVEAESNCNLSESTKVVEDGVSGLPKNEISIVIVDGNGAVKGHGSAHFTSRCVPLSTQILMQIANKKSASSEVVEHIELAVEMEAPILEDNGVTYKKVLQNSHC